MTQDTLQRSGLQDHFHPFSERDVVMLLDDNNRPITPLGAVTFLASASARAEDRHPVTFFVVPGSLLNVIGDDSLKAVSGGDLVVVGPDGATGDGQYCFHAFSPLPVVEAYAACSKASWGVYVEGFVQDSGVVDGGQTSNRASLCAIVKAIKHCWYCDDERLSCRPAVIHSCSEYAVRCAVEWLHKWHTGWRKSDKKPVKNRDLIEEIDELIQVRQGQMEPAALQFVHVRDDGPGTSRARGLAHAVQGAPHRNT
ncbi:unnamed protein product [Vitrella brassicaformis CCMP3155]|uniref:RNase H type-1 domain-containing protein n=1 Tax=Vitrella brassicaformis (strain CCMP3155) TaxID=1169540 RepID=A0A0G4GQH1_VITBC|nr:unnamed protein product [Vitrella brassicaformis CCMP3155]|eukprot:CEM32699.1 unnamed protein product [Vitrella brassicaformis CCMP3155]